MESAPPVPRKDTPRKQRSQVEMSSSVAKRKRENNFTYDAAPEDEDEDEEQTPKRHRASPSQDRDSIEPSDSASAQRRGTLRRKKGVNNLSSLNLRHKAEQARSTEQQARESKFQEGSLTDKPSQKPPSAFTRVIRTDSGNLEQLDTLMNEYHDGMPTPGESADEMRDIGRAEPAEQTSAFYRFGQRLANNFRPVALWKQIWNETKEELTLRNMELERKRRQKLEAEQQYAHMKQTGQIPTKRVGGTNMQRDSGVELLEESRLTSFGTGAARSGAASRADSHADGERTLRSRMHFTRPSISNLRLNLKKTQSDANLFGSSNRESSASLSPVKGDADAGTLRKTQSRVDLKKQHKLSKRVSDLEMKLNIARRELDEALTEASPMPKSSHDRFAPLSSKLDEIQSVGKRESSLAAMDPANAFNEPSTPDEVGKRLAITQATTPPTSDDVAYDGPTPMDKQPVPKSGEQQQRSKKRRSDRDRGDDESEDSRPEKLVKKTWSTVFQAKSQQHAENTTLVEHIEDEQDQTDLFQHYADELAHPSVEPSRNASVRLSIDSTAHSLDPVYEEEEGMMTVPLNDDPSRPTAVATPARFGRVTRSMSPVKRSAVKAEAEEVVLTRAADAAKNHRARQTPSQEAFEWPEDVF
ncbi:hypothetical protein AMS68_007310 [Peltaster fructicola]|uniref:Uncharacterized protein n=1 Tax=Peltaster fructicola TaxID=286661 RepID=A0A6H0Y461_9PEZI|nr:hypothetical protein AMS68_007310 [Peltaster fructicola]